MEKIMFKTVLLAAYSIISAPGKYELEVLSNVTEGNLVADADGQNPRYIANLKAVAADKLPQLKQVFADKQEVPIEETNGLFLTANIWQREGRAADLPMKGEKVEVTIDYVESREQEKVLRVTNIKRKPAVAAPKLDLASFFAPVTQTATAEKTLEHA
jgi:hypothetical protein